MGAYGECRLRRVLYNFRVEIIQSSKVEHPTKSEDRFDGSPAPLEPFACPSCGQMLAPSCRVCVACGAPVDPSQARQPAPVAAAPVPETPGPEKQPAGAISHFSWPVFFVCVAAYLLTAVAAERLLKPHEVKWFVGGLLVGCAAWVYVDARVRRVPHPLRWAVGAFLIWIVVFPWYISRRRKPETPCLVMEAQGTAFLRMVVWVIVIFFLFGLISVVLRKPPH